MIIKLIVPYNSKITIQGRTLACIEAIKRYFVDKGHTVIVKKSKQTLIAEARNAAIKMVIESFALKQEVTDCDYAICIDSDIVVTPQQIEKLIGYNYDVVSGAFPFRSEGTNEIQESAYVAGYWTDHPGLVESYVDKTNTGIGPVDWTGAGILIIRASVFGKINFPWFHNFMVDYKENDIPYRRESGEDMGFCLECKLAGIPIYLDCDCVVEHIG